MSSSTVWEWVHRWRVRAAPGEQASLACLQDRWRRPNSSARHVPADKARRISAGRTRLVPDRFAGAILGAFPGRDRRVGHLSVPARDDVAVVTALIGIPGSLIGMRIDDAVGSVRESREPGPA